MGKYILDQYSLLHFAVGVVAYFWGFSFLASVFVHVLFEWIENTELGMRFINRNLGGIWPGGKPAADSIVNRVGDTISFGVGWLASHALDTYGIAKQWY